MIRQEIPATPEGPYVEITRHGRFHYRARLLERYEARPPGYQGSAWFRTRTHAEGSFLTRRGAERSGTRALRRLLRQRGYEAEPAIRITA